MQSLDDVLEGNEAPVEVEPVTEEPTEVKGETAPSVVETKQDKPTAEEPVDQVPKTALLDERRKRQEAVRALQALQTQQPEAEKPDFWENPEKVIQGMESRFNENMQAMYLSVFEAQARGRHEDFDDQMEAFSEMVQKDATLYQRMLIAPDPAEFAYSTAKTSTEIEAAGNIDNYRAKVEAEVRQKMEAEYAEKFGQALEKSVPQSIANQRAAGNSQPEWTGPPSLDNILK